MKLDLQVEIQMALSVYRSLLIALAVNLAVCGSSRVAATDDSLPSDDEAAQTYAWAKTAIAQVDCRTNGKHPRKLEARDQLLTQRSMIEWIVSVFYVTRANHIHVKVRHKDHGVLATEMYFAGKDQDKIREKDHVFKRRRNGDRLIVPQENVTKYSDLGIQFDDKAVCCRFDLAFLL